MAYQKLGPNGQFGGIDVLTSSELKEAMGHAIDPVIRALRGEKLMRFPIVYGIAPTASFTLAATGGQAQPGPESGYLWRIQAVMVASASITDTAKYVLYGGSDTTQIAPKNLIDAIIGGATPGQNVNVGYRPGNKTVWLWPTEQIYAQITGATVGAVYTMTGIASEVPAEMAGKLVLQVFG
jgi:hypothetical protein